MKLRIGIILTAALVALSSCQPTAQKEQSMDKKETVLSVIHSRKSVRNFIKDKVVSKEDLTTLIKAGMAAPSAVNLQPWHFIVVDEREKLNELSAGLPYAKMLGTASAAIIVCGDADIKAGDMAFWIYDCSAASENILLAAEAMELGGVWTAVYPDESRVQAVKQTLNLPDNIIPLNCIPIGYPTGEDEPKDKFKENRIHWNTF